MSKKTHIYKRPPKESEPVRVIPKLLAKDLPNREGHQTPTYIVIHEVSLGTGRSPKSYNMDHYARKIVEDAQDKVIKDENGEIVKDENGNPKIKKGSTIGYHYLVGDKQVYQFLEDDVATSHTGTDFGNENSIGVERVICEGVNYEYATHNQAKLIATLMLKHNIPLKNVITHKEMQKRYGTPEQQENPKQCPARMLAGFRGTVQDFKNEIKRCLIHGWLFEEILDEKTISEIPKIKEIAKRRFAPKKEKTQQIHGLQDMER